MFKGIAIAAGSLGTLAAVGSGSIYGTGAFHNWMYSGQEVTFKFESSAGEANNQLTLRCAPKDSKSHPWITAGMHSTNKAYISCGNLLYYPPQNYLEVKKDLEGKYDPTGLKCTINTNKEVSCTFKENTKVKFSKGQEPEYEGLIALDW